MISGVSQYNTGIKIMQFQKGEDMLYPVLTDSRLVVDLSGVWDFKLDDGEKGFDERWYDGPLEDAMTMPVPGFLQ
jgi:beta-galactosidase/beta-glucuronidase